MKLVEPRPGSWAWWASALAACVLVISTDLRAQPEQYVDLSYEVDPAVEGCLSVEAFRTVVARRLGYDPNRPGSTPRVEVRVKGTETGIEGTIEWISTGEKRIGERRFSSPNRDCEDMTVTMAFVVAVQTQLMAAEPSAEGLLESPDKEPKPSDSSTSEQPPDEPRGAGDAQVHAEKPSKPPHAEKPPKPAHAEKPPKPRRAAREPAEWFATAGFGPAVGVGMGQHAVGLGRLFLSVHREWTGVELGTEATVPSTTRVEGGTGFRHELILGTLAACGSVRSIAACGVGKVGRIRVRGTGVDNPASPKGLVGQVGTRVTVSLRLDDHLTLQGHVEGLYLLSPWTIDLNQEEVWTMPQFSAIAGLGLARRFP